MREILISIQPKWCELIASGKKTVEIRKTKPKIKPPFKVYIYCTNAKEKPIDIIKYGKMLCKQQKVIGEFVCDDITGGFLISPWGDWLQNQTCLTYEEINAYCKDKPLFYWHISDLKIYDVPKELSDFRKPCIMPEMPYCPFCDKGYESISDDEAEFYRIYGECSTEWICLNFITRPPQSWCYVESKAY